MAGTFVWYELMTSDMKAAEAFYRDVIGWDAADSGLPGMSYTLFSANGTPVCGLTTVQADAAAMGARPGWIGYVGADDVDATAARIEELGGKVLRAPDDIPGIGRFAVAADPHGAVFCLFKGQGEGPAMPAMGTPGHFGWRELHAGDGPAAFDFYAELFGWTKGAAMDMGPMGVYQIFGRNGVDLGGIMTKAPHIPMPFWLYYVHVADIDAAGARVAAKGGQVVFGPQEVPGGLWILQCRDPQGEMFALVGARG
ncbi:VOC family protein [Labrys monachus]|uniref:VOC family protein n=1 Tax=Labrys monachus TaxID=217067 RepID=UPI0027D7C998|nr:VOC family protein [Labrys monachus]